MGSRLCPALTTLVLTVPTHLPLVHPKPLSLMGFKCSPSSWEPGEHEQKPCPLGGHRGGRTDGGNAQHGTGCSEGATTPYAHLWRVVPCGSSGGMTQRVSRGSHPCTMRGLGPEGARSTLSPSFCKNKKMWEITSLQRRSRNADQGRGNP